MSTRYVDSEDHGKATDAADDEGCFDQQAQAQQVQLEREAQEQSETVAD
jgi:hypothetical protein